MSTGAIHNDSDATDAVDVVLAHRQQAEYFSALSHELRTPLNGLLGYANLLVEGHYGGLSAGQEKAVGEIQASAKHLLGIIESLGAGYIGDLTGGFLGSHYQDVFAFFVLVLVLIFRPSGLLGERVGDRA